MHSKRCYKICIRLLILGELEAFRNYNVFSVIFQKILDAIERFTKLGNVSHSSLDHIF